MIWGRRGSAGEEMSDPAMKLFGSSIPPQDAEGPEHYPAPVAVDVEMVRGEEFLCMFLCFLGKCLVF